MSQPNPYSYEPPPPYTVENAPHHQVGSAGGKPVYVQGPPPPPPMGHSYQQPPYPTQPIIVTTQPQTRTHYVVPVGTPTIVQTGVCPSCRTGVLVDRFTVCGILCCIFLFPIGIFCCMFMTEKRCTNCHFHFD